MVTIVGYRLTETDQNEKYFSLAVLGEPEAYISPKGNYYLTASRAYIPCTFPEVYCQNLIGKQLSGHIEKVSCPPSYFTMPNQKEPVRVDFTYKYIPEQEGVCLVPSGKKVQT